MCDLTRADTLTSLERYAAELRQVVPDAVRFILAANKSDLSDQHQITHAQVEAVGLKLNAPVYTTSAKMGDEVDHLFRHLAGLLLQT